MNTSNVINMHISSHLQRTTKWSVLEICELLWTTDSISLLTAGLDKKKVNVGIIVQLSRDLMDWVSQRLCFAFGDTDRSVSWTSVYSLIRRTWGRMEFVHMLDLTPG